MHIRLPKVHIMYAMFLYYNIFHIKNIIIYAALPPFGRAVFQILTSPELHVRF